jgi:hypothetical protein
VGGGCPGSWGVDIACRLRGPADAPAPPRHTRACRTLGAESEGA